MKIDIDIQKPPVIQFYSRNFKTFSFKKTRLDTRPSVADGWAGAEICVFPLFNSSVTDRPTDQPTDGRTKSLIELRVRN